MELAFHVKAQIIHNMYSMSCPVKSNKQKYTAVKVGGESGRRGDDTPLAHLWSSGW